MTRMRTDIQCLRGWAILTVLLYHARLWPFASGFLGVDIFFVISGFLITGLIRRDIEHDRFSFVGFYFRRVRRLFPTAFLVFAAVATAAPVLLTTLEYDAFKKQLIGAMTLTGNIALWKQSGYFDGAAEFKPLLHVWSLAIEEQYYLFAPALLFLAPPRLWLRGALLVAIISFVAAITLSPWRPAAVFYLLLTRAWELAIGTIGALVNVTDRASKLVRFLFWPALAAIIFLPLTPPAGAQPGFVALTVCLATLIVILRNASAVEHAVAPLAYLGDVSYPLYLAHWPLLAFLRNVWIGPPPIEARLGVLGASLIIAALLYRYVETPMRRFDLPRKSLAIAGASALSLALAAAPLLFTPANADFAPTRRPNAGFDIACDFAGPFEPIAACRNSDAPTTLVWGDSIAMHIVPGLAASAPPLQFVQATRTTCGPLLGMAPAAKPGTEPFVQGYTAQWAERCIAFNDSVLAFLEATPSIRDVVLATRLSQYLDVDKREMLHARDGRVTLAPIAPQDAFDGLARTIEAIRALGRRVVIVAAPPSGGFDVGLCLERRANGKPTLGPFASCDIPLSVYRSELAPVDPVFDRLRRETDIDVISFDSALCGAEHCRTIVESTPLYRDEGHFTHDGARVAAKLVGLSAQIHDRAR